MKTLKTQLIALSCTLSLFAVMGQSHAAEKPFQRNYGLAGCGLGSVVMGKKGGQIFAATTNSTFTNQLFGITSGTLNCDDSAAAQMANRLDILINANKVAVSADFSRGNGEMVASISKILKCSDEAAFGNAMQGNFAQIFPRYDVQANEITDSILTTVIQNTDLSKSCEIQAI